jgi:hypothetical protein
VAIHDQEADRVWTELTWSPDTKIWNRIDPRTPLIPCSETKLEYDYGCVYPCAYPVFTDDEIRLYYGGSDYLHFGWRNGSLCLATLRQDGFAGYEQLDDNHPAVITTTNIPNKDNFQITADVGENGWIRVSILNTDGELITSSERVAETATRENLIFSEKITLDEVKVQFEFSNAKLYSFRFSDKNEL